MNYKTIAKFIKDRRNLIIWDEPGLQWISDGVAVYPVFGMPKMNETEMIVFLGLEKDKDKISVRRRPVPPEIPLGDMENNDDIINNRHKIDKKKVKSEEDIEVIRFYFIVKAGGEANDS